MTTTIPSPFARTQIDAQIDDVENIDVPDFDHYHATAFAPVLVSDALTKEERTLLSGSRERNSLSMLSPVDLSRLPTEATQLHLYGEAKMDGTDALCCASSDNGTFLASGCRNGCTAIYRLPDSLGNSPKPEQLHHVYEIQPQDNTSSYPTPVESLTFLHTSQDSTKYILASAQAGTVTIYHVATQRVLSRASLPNTSGLSSSKFSEKLLTVSASPLTCQMLAAGGSKGSVVLYDSSGSSMQPTCRFTVPGPQSGGGTAQAHSSRVLALEWHPQDCNVLFSGGWDNTVKMWDVRMQRPALTIEGPHIGAQGLAANSQSNCLATASTRAEHPLQLWDLRTGQLRTNLPLFVPKPAGKAANTSMKSCNTSSQTQTLLKLFCVAWITQDTLICGGSGGLGQGTVKAVSIDTSVLESGPVGSASVDVCVLNCSAVGPMAAVAASTGIALLGSVGHSIGTKKQDTLELTNQCAM